MAGYWIHRYLLEILPLQIVERLRPLLFVDVVLRNQLAEREQILAQHGFTRLFDGVAEVWHRNRYQDRHDADHDDQFQQREAPAMVRFGIGLHLPVLILGSIERSALRFCVNVKQVVAAP